MLQVRERKDADPSDGHQCGEEGERKMDGPTVMSGPLYCRPGQPVTEVGSKCPIGGICTGGKKEEDKNRKAERERKNVIGSQPHLATTEPAKLAFADTACLWGERK